MAAETLGPVGREHNASSQMYVKRVAKGANAVSLGGFPSLFLQSFKEPTPTFARLTAWDKAVLPQTPLKPRTAMVFRESFGVTAAIHFSNGARIPIRVTEGWRWNRECWRINQLPH